VVVQGEQVGRVPHEGEGGCSGVQEEHREVAEQLDRGVQEFLVNVLYELCVGTVFSIENAALVDLLFANCNE
jgi:hypothetical protein